MSRSGLRAVVIGAGVAGLACAGDLVAAGATVRVLEAGDAVGGRMRTDRRAGFVLDQGFQVATYTVAGALPAMAAPHPLTRGSRVGPGRYVCGDHRATGSVQGALASGARAAREILAAT